ncbi:MAG: hypothetical protein PHV93_04655 [Candidatus Pacebacteria bacterium]|nr:hypothetical protein [Candidatus Paceibacterota bacterium]
MANLQKYTTKSDEPNKIKLSNDTMAIVEALASLEAALRSMK